VRHSKSASEAASYPQFRTVRWACGSRRPGSIRLCTRLWRRLDHHRLTAGQFGVLEWSSSSKSPPIHRSMSTRFLTVGGLSFC